MSRKSFHVCFLVIAVVSVLSPVFAKAEGESLLVDRNGDGDVSIVAFGDSITFGLGDDGIPLLDTDGIQRLVEAFGRLGKGGYPKRLSDLLQITVDNRGVPGEELLVSGVNRIPSVLLSSQADIFILLEGVNDAIHLATSTRVRFAIQKGINAARYLGKLPVLMTYPTPVNAHEALAPFTHAYSVAVQELGVLNDLPVVDLERAWRTTCANASDCNLYNIPEGLHPNDRGYDVLAQTVAATLLGIDVFALDGAAQLESALGLPAGTVLVKSGA